VKTESTLSLKLLGVIGDLTGHPGESSLIVETFRSLPTDKTLVGRMITVNHRISPVHTSGYVIERVQKFGSGRYRIDLRDCPPFILHHLFVTGENETDARKIDLDTWLLKGKTIYTGRRARFPRSGFESAMTLGKGKDPWHCKAIELENVPKTDDVRLGDPIVIYQIRPGDEVVIPSHFACKGTDVPEGLQVDVVSTGPATLIVPGEYRNASMLLKSARIPLTAVKREAGGLRIELKQDNLTDGRSTLLLSR
jgi:hypothetical protein